MILGLRYDDEVHTNAGDAACRGDRRGAGALKERQMAQATDAQVQRFADERLRPRAEQLVRILNAMVDDRAAIDDVYDRLANGSAWTDGRRDGPPKMLSKNELLSYNTFAADLIAFIQAHPSWPVVRSAAVNSPTV